MRKDKSVLLSIICLWLFFALLVMIDVFSWPVCSVIADRSEILNRAFELSRWHLMGTLYACSVPAYIALYFLFMLLKNIRNDEIYIPANVRCLRVTCWCFTAAFVIMAVSSIYYVMFIFLAAACGFVALIVHIVKNVIERAVDMKDELDLTI